MAYWFIGADDELLLDLDNYEKRVERYGIWGEMFRQRLRDAIRAEKLKIRFTNGEADIFLEESNSPNHFHVFIGLAEPMPLMRRMSWQLRLASDWKRSHADLMRGACHIAPASLLIRREKVQGWREPDYTCSCTEKHETLRQVDLLNAGRGCPVWQKLRGATPWELFGEPTHQGMEMPVNLPVGRVPITKIMQVGRLKGVPETPLKPPAIRARKPQVESEPPRTPWTLRDACLDPGDAQTNRDSPNSPKLSQTLPQTPIGGKNE